MTVSRPTRWTLRVVALAYLAALLLVPVGLVFYRTFEPGPAAVWDSITTPAAIHAFWLTIEIAAIAVPLNTAFGSVLALALVRGRFRGKSVVNAIKQGDAITFTPAAPHQWDNPGAAPAQVVLVTLRVLP